MRRFPNASTIRYQLHRIFVTAMLAVAVLALLGKAAHAQCRDIEAQLDTDKTSIETALAGVDSSCDQAFAG
jgi:hypothetical protein